MPRKCCFCPRNADSQEHVWSKWILELLPSARNGVFTQRLKDGTYKTRGAVKPEITSGIVCRHNCNNGWMSLKLEAPMKAATSGIILENKRKTFSPEQCGSIANCAFKTTVLANHIRLIGEPFFSEHDRYAFAKDQTIPKGVQVGSRVETQGT